MGLMDTLRSGREKFDKGAASAAKAVKDTATKLPGGAADNVVKGEDTLSSGLDKARQFGSDSIGKLKEWGGTLMKGGSPVTPPVKKKSRFAEVED